MIDSIVNFIHLLKKIPPIKRYFNKKLDRKRDAIIRGKLLNGREKSNLIDIDKLDEKAVKEMFGDSSKTCDAELPTFEMMNSNGAFVLKYSYYLHGYVTELLETKTLKDLTKRPPRHPRLASNRAASTLEQ